MMKMTLPRLKIEWDKTIAYFKERDKYKQDLKGWIKKYGLVNLPASVQRTIPTSFKVLYEVKWWLQPVVWWRILQITWLNTHNEGLRRLSDG